MPPPREASDRFECVDEIDGCLVSVAVHVALGVSAFWARRSCEVERLVTVPITAERFLLEIVAKVVNGDSSTRIFCRVIPVFAYLTDSLNCYRYWYLQLPAYLNEDLIKGKHIEAGNG